MASATSAIGEAGSLSVTPITGATTSIEGARPVLKLFQSRDPVPADTKLPERSVMEVIGEAGLVMGEPKDDTEAVKGDMPRPEDAEVLAVSEAVGLLRAVFAIEGS